MFRHSINLKQCTVFNSVQSPSHSNAPDTANISNSNVSHSSTKHRWEDIHLCPERTRILLEKADMIIFLQKNCWLWTTLLRFVTASNNNCLLCLMFSIYVCVCVLPKQFWFVIAFDHSLNKVLFIALCEELHRWQWQPTGHNLNVARIKG